MGGEGDKMGKTKRKQKEIKKDYIKEYLEYADANKEHLTIEELEDGLRMADKKQKEYDSIGRSRMRLADHIELEFYSNDEEKIMNSIKKTQRELGLLQDEEFKKMFDEFTPFQVEHYHENRKMILEEKRQYHVSFTHNGIVGTIGTPNLKAMAEWIVRDMYESDLESLSADTQATLFFNKLSRGK
jgi:hypothetical protein